MSPIESTKELPKGVKVHLPEHAKKIFLEAFNHALAEYKKKEKRRNADEDLDSIASKVAWAAVKKKYIKVGDVWKEK